MINYDITGKDTVSSLDRMRYHKKRLPILKGIGYTTLILGALGGIGFGVYKLMQNPTKLNSIKKNLA